MRDVEIVCAVFSLRLAELIPGSGVVNVQMVCGHFSRLLLCLAEVLP